MEKKGRRNWIETEVDEKERRTGEGSTGRHFTLMRVYWVFPIMGSIASVITTRGNAKNRSAKCHEFLNLHSVEIQN